MHLKFPIITGLFLSLLLCLWAAPANAQDSVDVRTGAHADYSRLVFEWSNVPSYEVDQQGDSLMINFAKEATPNMSGINTQGLSNIGTVSVASPAGEPLVVKVRVAPESKLRHFKIGKRIIVDVYNGAGEPMRDASASTSKSLPQSSPKKKEQPSVPVANPPTQTTLAQKNLNEADKVVAPTSSLSTKAKVEMPALPMVKVQGAPLVGDQPHVITLSSTKNVGMVAFERSGYLWIVLDDPSLKVAPVISGPSADKFPKFERFDLNGGVAYRMRQPDGFFYYAEGGGQLWRLIVTPNARRSNPVRVETMHNEDMSGGSLTWAMNNTGRVLTLNDPLVGDNISLVLVTDSGQYAGAGRNYVELRTLDSFVGLALVPKASDLKLEAMSTEVEAKRTQGLALSPKRDTAPVELKADVQDIVEEEKADPDYVEEEVSQSRIYNFGRWEMGGDGVLEKNTRVLMIGLGDKEGGAKIEDLLTIAKLDLANGRGHEALGILSLVQEELKGIEETPEFLSLRGAANVISGKPDAAIKDLSVDSLKKFGEIKYWKAMALAGLEDWKQANDNLNSDFTIIDEYPKHIREKVALTLAEVSLRNARIDEAEDLLSLIDSDDVRLSLSKKSAWKYLMGELYLQLGDDEKALEYWKKLSNGEDDYYRAKAGLSLTKLQLDNQKITPAKAVDRLEGLRYVWRGDELETLINYRLGEVYIENDDYMKGLSVLRNAISLSPESEMAREVTDFMSQNFRDLFTEERLAEVSPLDSLQVYEEFKELTPAGKEGDLFVLKLAQRLADADLLGRASALLEYQLKSRLQGADALTGAIRLSAIRLLDNKPEMALDALDIAQNALGQARNAGGDYSAQARQIKLLRARALSKSNQINDALQELSSLSNGEDVLRLRADIAWEGKRWPQAAQAFGTLIQQDAVSTTQPPSNYEADLILNRAIALNLAGDRVSLDNWRQKYDAAMKQSNKAQLFDLITRQRTLGMVNNKDTITNLVSEVDMFGDFLQRYQKGN